MSRSNQAGGWSWRRAAHRALDAVERRWAPGRRLGPRAGRAWVRLLDATVSLQSDRAYLRRSILPAIRRERPARVLFVGTRGYTAGYGRMYRGTGTEWWTADIDPAAATWGEPGRHVTADARHLDDAFPPGRFDVVILNGVLGWGVDTPEDMARTLDGAARVLAPGGRLLLGWNADRIADPEAAGLLRAFVPAGLGGLPPRRTFADVTHVFASYRLADAPAVITD